jgi:hypothetical protein
MDTRISSFWDWFTASHDSVARAYDRHEFRWLDAEPPFAVVVWMDRSRDDRGL